MLNKIRQLLGDKVLIAIKGWALSLISTQQMGQSPVETGRFLDMLSPQDFGSHHFAETLAYYKEAPRH